MKYIVIGLHGSGKQELYDMFKHAGLHCGRLFTNDTVFDNRYESYSNEEIADIFENKAYMFIKECDEMNPNSYEGLSLYEWDNNDVFVLSPDQMVSIPQQAFNDDVCIVWMDNNRAHRHERYDEERRSYDWSQREHVETRNIDDFIKMIYNNKWMSVIYFNNEDIERVYAVVTAVVRHSDLVSLFTKHFN